MKKALALILAIANIVLLAIIIKAPKDTGGIDYEPPTVTDKSDKTDTSEVMPNSTQIEQWLLTGDTGSATETEQGTTTDIPQGMTTETEQGSTEPRGPSRDWSGVDSPSDSDWDWVYGMMWQGVPDKAEYITDPYELTGRWKTLYLFPDGDEGYSVMKMSNVDVSIDDEGVKVANTPYMIDVGEGWFYDTDGVSIYSGSMDEYGGLYASSQSGNFAIYFFCEYDGYQFALGQLTVPSGEIAYIAMKRP